MRRGLALVALVLGAGGCLSTPGRPGAPPSATNRSDLIRRILASTVQLRAEREGGIRRAASGVVIATDPAGRRAWIVTVRHFVAAPDPQEVYVQLPGRTSAVPAAIVAASGDRDVALIEVDDLDVMPVRLKELASLGDEILIVAFPWGQRFTVVRGTVSQIVSPEGEARVAGPARMVDASVSYGSSGGGVFDAQTGELVGIVESYRTAKIAIPEVTDRVIEVPVPGETTLIPAPVIARLIANSGLGGRLAK